MIRLLYTTRMRNGEEVCWHQFSRTRVMTGVVEKYVREMQDLFDGKTVTRYVVGVTDWFSVGVDYIRVQL